MDLLDRTAWRGSIVAVTLQPNAMLRHALAAVLVLAMMVAGIGRGVAAASDAAAAYGVPGVILHICHADAEGGSGPAEPARHDCCEACAIQAPFVLAAPPKLPGPAVAVRAAEPADVAAWSPLIARLRTPRQAQGPPVT